ncbi:hypothetical protein CAL7716_066250 [Calothrix sp. PCC 7716]|nr:hypothetical protein CAL7716_066250 [Calothrix sp. PCC 7716]
MDINKEVLMSKCITYYVQTDRINQLVNNFGAKLEKLTFSDKLALRAILSYWLLHVQAIDFGEYSLIYASERLMHEYPKDCLATLREVIIYLEGISINEAEGLIEALTSQLRWDDNTTHSHINYLYLAAN